MPVLEVNGREVEVDDGFLTLSPAEQERAVDEIAASLKGNASQDARPANPEQPSGQGYGDAATTWLEHAISDLPVVGPYIQKGSDYLGTEVYGRLTGQDPAQMRADIDKRRAQRTEANPASAFSGGLAGNLAAFGGAGATATGARALGMEGATFGSRVLNSARTSGALSASDSLARGESAAQNINSGVIGTGIGAAIPLIGGAVRLGVGAVGDRIAPTIGAMRNAPQEAERRLGVAVERDRAADPTALLSAKDEAMARYAGVPLLNADRGGETTRALARSVANQSPEARAVIEKTASDRFAGQSQRAVEFVRKLTGGAVDDLGYQKAIQDTARLVNKPAYERAFAKPAAQDMWNAELQQLMQAPAMQAAARAATTRGANRAAVEGFQAFKNPFVEHNGRFYIKVNQDGSVVRPTLRFWDQVQRNLRSEIGKAGRAGDDTLKGDLTALKSQLVRVLDNTVPEFRTARQGAASFFGADDAIEAGKNFANTPKAIPEARLAYAKFSGPEKAGFQTGYASELIDRIKASGDRTNVINSVFKSQAAREQLELVFGSQKLREIEAYVRVEDLADRLRGAMGNSTTARQLWELGIGAGAGAAYGGFDLQSIGSGAALGLTAGRAAHYLGQAADQKVMQQIAKLLISDDPAALKRAAANAALSPAYMRRLEDLGRMIGAPARGAALAVAQ